MRSCVAELGTTLARRARREGDGGPLPAASLTIDDFESTYFNFTDTQAAGTSLNEVSGIPTANTVGGVRMVRVATTGSVSATGAAVLVTTPADDGAVLSTIGVPDGSSDFQFIYDGIADGLTNGSSGALNLDLSSAGSIDITATAVNVTADVRLTLFSSTTAVNSALIPLANGTTSIALGSLPPINLADIKSIQVALFGVDLGEVPIITNISTPLPVPEPTSGLLLLVGLVGLTVRRGR